MLLLLIHDDKAQIFHRRENRRAGPHHHIHLSPADAFVFIQPLTEGKGAVNDRHPAAEGRQKPADGLRGQRDFRDKDNAPPALGQHPVGQGEVNGGFSAAGHPVQKPGPAAFPVALPQRFHCGGLFLGQGGGRLHGDGLFLQRGAQHFLFVGFGQALLHQLFHHAAGHPGKVANFPDAAAAHLPQQLIDLLLLGGQLFWLGFGQAHHLQGFIAHPALHHFLPPQKAQGLQPLQRQRGEGKPQCFGQIGGRQGLAAGPQNGEHLLLGEGEILRDGGSAHQGPPGEPPQAVAGRNEHGQGIEPGAEGVFPQPAQQEQPFLGEDGFFLQRGGDGLEGGVRGLFGQLHHQPDTAAVPKGHQHPHSGAEGHPLGDGVIEKFIKTAGGFFHRYPGNRGQTAYLLFGKWGD